MPALQLLDLATRWWWRRVGRPIDPYGNESWLAAPSNPPGCGGDDWMIGAATDGLDWAEPDAATGLVETMSHLAGPSFDPARLDPQVADFYEHTSAWELDVWSQWSALARPFGEAIARLFGRRVKQLALPIDPLEVSRGMDSRVVLLRSPSDAAGVRAGAAWLRTLRLDGSAVYSGFYRIGDLPGDPQPRVYVSFPLEEGSVQVYLRPTVDADGSLWLRSSGGRWGGDGAYVVVRVGGRWYAALTWLYEEFHVFTDERGELRTDHTLRLGPLTALRLHYRMRRVAGSQRG